MLADAFSKILHAYDPLLSLRWGERTGCWIIDRKEHIGREERKCLHYFANEVKHPTPEDLEHWRSVQLGQRLLFLTNTLDNSVYDKIRLRDIRKNPTALLGARAKRIKALEREKDAAAHEKARAATDVIAHLLRKQDSAMLHGHTDEIMRAALQLPPKPKPKPTVTVLADAYGVVPKKDAPRIQLATR